MYVHFAAFCLAARMTYCNYSPDTPSNKQIIKDHPIMGPYTCHLGQTLMFIASVNDLLIIHSSPEPVVKGQNIQFKRDVDDYVNGLKKVNLHIAVTTELITMYGTGWTYLDHGNQVGDAAQGLIFHINCMKDVFIVYIGQIKPKYRTMDRYVKQILQNINGTYQFSVMGGHPELFSEHDRFGFSQFQHIPFEMELGTADVGTNNGRVIMKLFIRGSKYGDFDISFYQGDNIGFDMSFRFKKEKIIMNSRENGQWGTEQLFDLFFSDPPWANTLMFIFENAVVKVYADNINHLIGSYSMSSTVFMNKMTITKNDIEEEAMLQPVDILSFEQVWEV